MEIFSSYILTIAGVILISVIVELVMPDGQMNKYIKSIFAIFVVGVIIAPLPSLLSSKTVHSIFDYNDYQIQGDYISSLNQSKLDTLEIEEEKLLASEGYKNIKLEFSSSDLGMAEVSVNLVNIDLTKLVIENNAEHKDINGIKLYLNQRYLDKFKLEESQIIYEV